MRFCEYLKEKNLLITTFVITFIAIIAEILAMGHLPNFLSELVLFYLNSRIFILSSCLLIIIISFFKISKQDNGKIKITFISDWLRIALKLSVIVFYIFYFIPKHVFLQSIDNLSLYGFLPHIFLLSATLILAILIYLAWKKPIDNIVCMNCGTKFPTGQKFCKKCSNKLN